MLTVLCQIILKVTLDVLAADAGNKQALQGLMMLDTNTKQFAGCASGR
jgi:hypothetical protein